MTAWLKRMTETSSSRELAVRCALSVFALLKIHSRLVPETDNEIYKPWLVTEDMDFAVWGKTMPAGASGVQ